MKIENLNELSVEALGEKLKEMGIRDTRLDKAISASYLPDGKQVKFVDIEISNPETEQAAILLITADGDKVSVSRLQRAGFMGEPTDADILKSNRTGNFYLRSNFTPNPSLSGNQAAVVKRLVGNTFKTKKHTMKVAAFNPDGYTEKGSVAVVPYDTWELLK